jgi:hypothetical protein
MGLANSGLGHGLYSNLKMANSDTERATRLESSKQRTRLAIVNEMIQPRLSTRLRSTLLNNLPNLPSLEIANKHVNPVASALFQEYLPGGPNWGATNQPKPLAIIEFCRSRLDWSDLDIFLKTLEREQC